MRRVVPSLLALVAVLAAYGWLTRERGPEPPGVEAEPKAA